MWGGRIWPTPVYRGGGRGKPDPSEFYRGSVTHLMFISLVTKFSLSHLWIKYQRLCVHTSLWSAKKAAFSLASCSDWHCGPWTINPLDSFTWHTTRPCVGVNGNDSEWGTCESGKRRVEKSVMSMLPVCCVWSWSQVAPYLKPHRCRPALTPYCPAGCWQRQQVPEKATRARRRAGRLFLQLEGESNDHEEENIEEICLGFRNH